MLWVTIYAKKHANEFGIEKITSFSCPHKGDVCSWDLEASIIVLMGKKDYGYLFIGLLFPSLVEAPPNYRNPCLGSVDSPYLYVTT